MATTTNFGWTTPNDTDLVKDGAAAIRTLGSSIDTSMAQLKGGTTGQVLSKTSNTDMAFTWVAQDDSNAIQNALVDAKGDLIAASANDTPARLAVGNNGETLVADSSTSTGLRYVPATVISNPVINSSFQIAQRGTTFTVGNGYTLDRWYTYSASAGRTITRQTTGDTTNLPNIQYCARVQRDNGNTATGEVQFYNLFETINSIPFAGKTITLSFYARKGANYSPATANALECEVTSGPNTDLNPISGGTWANKFINTNVTLTTTWQRFTVTGTMPSTDTQLFVRFRIGGNAYTGTAGAADYYEVTGVQLDVGSVALPFRTNGATLQGELAACQRYYFRTSSATNNNPVYTNFGIGYAINTGAVASTVTFPVSMRVAPNTIDTSATSTFYWEGASAGNTPTSIAVGGSNQNNQGQVTYSKAASFVTGSVYSLFSYNTQTAYIGFSAEL